MAGPVRRSRPVDCDLLECTPWRRSSSAACRWSGRIGLRRWNGLG